MIISPNAKLGMTYKQYKARVIQDISLFAGFSFDPKHLSAKELEIISHSYMNNVAYQDCAKRIIR